MLFSCIVVSILVVTLPGKVSDLITQLSSEELPQSREPSKTESNGSPVRFSDEEELVEWFTKLVAENNEELQEALDYSPILYSMMVEALAAEDGYLVSVEMWGDYTVPMVLTPSHTYFLLGAEGISVYEVDGGKGWGISDIADWKLVYCSGEEKTSKPSMSEDAEEQSSLEIEDIEQETFRLINMERERAGVSPTKWDDELYKLSKAHTREMADRGEIFHTPIGASYGENCWGGKGYYHYNKQELAEVIVDTWMSSPLHRAWLLHEPLRTSVASIVVTPDGQYASWTFWMSEVGEGPALVRELSNKWREETGGSILWIEWLRMKGYL